jgi:hypothetical protein
MSRATPKMRAFAGRLIADETKGNRSSEIKGPTALQIFEKLRPHLATLTGTTGFRGLISRALMLANAEVPWLCRLQVRADGSVEGFDGTDAWADTEETAERNVVLVAQLLGLLVAFIGEQLALQMVREVWPKLSFDALDFE